MLSQGNVFIIKLKNWIITNAFGKASKKILLPFYISVYRELLITSFDLHNINWIKITSRKSRLKYAGHCLLGSSVLSHA